MFMCGSLCFSLVGVYSVSRGNSRAARAAVCVYGGKGKGGGGGGGVEVAARWDSAALAIDPICLVSRPRG